MSENIDVILYLTKGNFTTKAIASIYWTKGDPEEDRRVFCLSAMNGEEQITAYISKAQFYDLAEQAGLSLHKEKMSYVERNGEKK